MPIRPLRGADIQVIVREAANISKTADQVRAPRRADEVKNSGFLDAVRPSRPMSVAAGICVIHVHGVPDGGAGGIANVLGIKWVNCQRINPPTNRRLGLFSLGIIHSRPSHIGRSRGIAVGFWTDVSPSLASVSRAVNAVVVVFAWG